MVLERLKYYQDTHVREIFLAFEYFQQLQYTSALGLIWKPRKKKLYPSLHSNLFIHMKKQEHQ